MTDKPEMITVAARINLDDARLLKQLVTEYGMKNLSEGIRAAVRYFVAANHPDGVK